MSKGPGFYSELGKKTKVGCTRSLAVRARTHATARAQSSIRLFPRTRHCYRTGRDSELYRLCRDQNFSTTGIKRGEAFSADIGTSFRRNNISADVKVDTTSNILASINVDEFCHGAKSTFSFTIPDQKSGKVEVQYSNDHAGITGSIGLMPNPILEVTAALGGEGVVLGGELGNDTATGRLTKYNAGLGLTKPDFSTAVQLLDKGDVLKSSYVHLVSPTSRTQIAAEIAHRFSKNENTFTVGGLYDLDSFTAFKGRLNNHGKMGALVQHEWRPKSLITISGEIDTKALDKGAKIGLALALKP